MLYSLAIPCYNESANLPLLVERCRRLIERAGIEIVLVDNGSTDGSEGVMGALLAGQDKIRSVRVDVNQGYGHGILTGLRAARGDILGWTHADLQTDPLDLLEGMKFFETAPDPSRLFVKGRRYGRPFADIVFTTGMAAFETALLRTPMWDINAQPTLFPRRFFESWSEPPSDFSLDLYAYYMARRRGLAVQRFPVRFGERAHGVSHWNVNWAAKRRFIRRTIGYSLQLRRDLAASREV